MGSEVGVTKGTFLKAFREAWGGVVHKILVSAQGPLVLVLRLRGLGPGLDNNKLPLSGVTKDC